jgi:hypothetical protein
MRNFIIICGGLFIAIMLIGIGVDYNIDYLVIIGFSCIGLLFPISLLLTPLPKGK